MFEEICHATLSYFSRKARTDSLEKYRLNMSKMHAPRRSLLHGSYARVKRVQLMKMDTKRN